MGGAIHRPRSMLPMRSVGTGPSGGGAPGRQFSGWRDGGGGARGRSGGSRDGEGGEGGNGNADEGNG